MSDLTNYFTRVDELERQLRNAVSLASHYKKRCQKLSLRLEKQPKPPSRTRQAIQLILKGNYTVSEVAELCFLSKSAIYNIRWRIKADGADCVFTGRTPKHNTKFCDIDLKE